jgi:hypothetical protein
MEQKLKHIIKKTLEVTESLFAAQAPSDANFINVLLGIYRVSFTTLRDIYYLSNNEDTGGSAVALMRKLIEYVIVVEYMLWKGKEKMAKQFQDHRFKEIHDEIIFLKSIGQDPSNQSGDLKINVEHAIKNYNSLSKKAKGRERGWTGISIEEMMKKLYEEKRLEDFDFSRISQAYVWGCRLNHVSPTIVKNFMNKDDATVASNTYLKQALLISTLLHIRLTTRYIDEIRLISGEDDHEELANRVALIWNEISSLSN